MKVRETVNNPSNIAGIVEKEDKKVASGKETGFQSRLKNVENANFEERVNQLVNSIAEQGEKLGKKIDIRELKIYKQLVSEFLDIAVNNTHKFSKKNFLDRRGRHRVFAVIKTVNENLDMLTQDVLSEEKDHIKILQRLDDIRGLILDILM